MDPLGFYTTRPIMQKLHSSFGSHTQVAAQLFDSMSKLSTSLMWELIRALKEKQLYKEITKIYKVVFFV